MDFYELVKPKKCSCGITHTCDIKHIIIEDNAILKIPSLIEDYKNIVLVADNNTAKACGDKVYELIKDKVNAYYIFDDELLVPDESAIERLENVLTTETDLIIGVGSGVIQDLCKYVSFKSSLPYHIVATAPSMDGYASKGAAMIINNMKVTYNAHVPEAIIGDTEVLKDAPIDMICAGYGDIIGKHSCLNDWKLSAVVNDEYFCDYVYNLTFDMLKKTECLGKALNNRDKNAVKTLTEALIGVGIAMALVGNSRPASGSEHHLSHYFEITGLIDDKPYFMHGTDVAFSAVHTAKIRKELLNTNINNKFKKFDREDWENGIRAVYKKAADGVIELQDKLGWYTIDRIPTYREKWAEICKVLDEAVSPHYMLSLIDSVGLRFDDFAELYGEEKIKNSYLYAKDLKDRYSVLWMYYDLRG